MATSSITRQHEIKDVKRFIEAVEESERQEEYLDDLNDIFPFVPKGEFKRVKSSKPK
jgi:hypothetical protein